MIGRWAQTHPRRIPGATIFDNEPVSMVWSGRYFFKGGGDLPENRSSPYASSSTTIGQGAGEDVDTCLPPLLLVRDP